VPGPQDYFQLESVAASDSWSQLGFESGDVFVRLNGHDLAGFEGVLRAFDAVAPDSKLVVEFVRGDRTGTTTLVLE
jgi:type II secretory pathway component PulC